MILKLGLQHQGLKLYKVYINDDPGLTLTYFTARSNLVAHTFEWGKVLQSHLMGETCSKGLNWLNNCVYEKKNVCPCPGAIYMCMTIIFKHLLLWNRLASKKVYIIGPGHMTKMAAMPIYDKNLQKSSPAELIVLLSWNLAWCIMYRSSTKFI